MIPFIVFFLVFSALVFTKPIQKSLHVPRWLWWGFALLCLGCYLGYFLISGDPLILGPDEDWYERTPWKHAILFCLMLLGMSCNVFVDCLKARIKAKQSNGKVPMPPFIWEKLALPAAMSLIVFYVIWQRFGGEKLDSTQTLLCFQNGFFWQVIVEKLKGPETGSPPGESR